MKRIYRAFLSFCAITLFSCTPEVNELNWQQEEGYRWAKLQIDKSGQPGFRKLSSSQTGIFFSNQISDDLIERNQVLMNGSGVAVGDINGNGWIDIYFTRLDGPNKLYLNQGAFQFKDITEKAGVAHDGYFSTGAVFSDVNGNGFLDLIVTSINKENTLYINDGEGNFTVKVNSGLGSANGSMTMALADVSGNGYPDLYVTNYRKETPRNVFNSQELTFENMLRGDSLVAPYSDYFVMLGRDKEGLPIIRTLGAKDDLYINNGGGRFKKVKDLENRFLNVDGSPKGLYPDWGLSAKFQDLNGNGLQDLYVANDFWTPDRIWINQGDGTFRALDTLAIRNSSYSSMGVDFSDINRNGMTDIFVVEMLSAQHELRLRQMNPVEHLSLEDGEFKNRPRYNRNSLYLNRGDGTYAEISYFSGLQASEWSWAVKFMDVDLDGYEDVIVNNGFRFDLQDLDAHRKWAGLPMVESILDFPPLRQKNKAFRNNGDLTFSDVSTEWGFNDKDLSFGLALADLNNNGAQDLIVNRMNDPSVIYENTTPADRISIRLSGELPNTQAIGAKVKLSGGPVESQTKQIVSGGDYLSGSDPLLMFAADSENENHQLVIYWPDGTMSILQGLHANRIYDISEVEIPKRSLPVEEVTNSIEPLFSDATEQLGYKHYENTFDDFERVQPLLPIKLSRLGPAMALLDLTGNGREDLLIGSGKGMSPAGFVYNSNGEFSSLDLKVINGYSSGDHAGIVGWNEYDRTHIVVGNSNYEQGILDRGTRFSDIPSAFHMQLQEGKVIALDTIPGTMSTTGPLAAADYTGDGKIDLFVGGRFLPGRYPMDSSSRLFKNENGKLVLDEVNSILLDGIGLVTSAMFIDYNRNGSQDLVIATEWGTIRVFENVEGEFIERTEVLGLGNYKGWWQGIAAGDFTANGYPDLVVSNWGTNSPYQVEHPEKPLKLFYEDFSWNGKIDVIDSYFDRIIGDYVPRRQFAEYESMIGGFYQIESNQKFASSSVEEILRQKSEEIPSKEINTLQHMIFLNEDGKKFKALPLPSKAQFSAGFYVGVADFDNDGNEDIFISQNFFSVSQPRSQPRLDAGRSLLLKGDGRGQFDAVPGHLSGLKIYGEQRGAAMGDITGNGRTDLLVSQNSAEIRFFTNQTEKRGLSVKLSGPPGNTSGIGSSIRLVYEDGSKGPMRYVQSGSGYWSQNSATQILGMSQIPVAIQVFWFDGEYTVYPVDFDIQLDYVIEHPE